MPMTEFDPYFTWLGIHTDGRPPNHYELLGVELFESDLATIEEAALRRIVLLRSIASGEYERLVSQILNEISAARRSTAAQCTSGAAGLYRCSAALPP